MMVQQHTLFSFGQQSVAIEAQSDHAKACLEFPLQEFLLRRVILCPVNPDTGIEAIKKEGKAAQSGPGPSGSEAFKLLHQAINAQFSVAVINLLQFRVQGNGFLQFIDDVVTQFRWAQCTDTGARNENFIASHLLKAVHFWTDLGLGSYDLHYLRDKERREVDFLVSRDKKPWFMVEVKSSMNDRISPHLEVFRKQLSIEHTFQVTIDGDFVEKDVFQIKQPMIVPAKTFLSQLP